MHVCQLGDDRALSKGGICGGAVDRVGVCPRWALSSPNGSANLNLIPQPVTPLKAAQTYLGSHLAALCAQLVLEVIILLVRDDGLASLLGHGGLHEPLFS